MYLRVYWNFQIYGGKKTLDIELTKLPRSVRGVASVGGAPYDDGKNRIGPRRGLF